MSVTNITTVATLLKTLGISQKELAEAAGLKQSTISQKEYSRHSFRPDSIVIFSGEPPGTSSFAKYLKLRFAGSCTIGCRSLKNKTTWFSGNSNFFCKSILEGEALLLLVFVDYHREYRVTFFTVYLYFWILNLIQKVCRTFIRPRADIEVRANEFPTGQMFAAYALLF